MVVSELHPRIHWSIGLGEAEQKSFKDIEMQFEIAERAFNLSIGKGKAVGVTIGDNVKLENNLAQKCLIILL